METEAADNQQVHKVGEATTPMDTDEPMNSGGGDAAAANEAAQGSMENPAEGQHQHLLQSQMNAGGEALNHHQAGEAASNHLPMDQMDAGHDNLATLASIAGAEAAPLVSTNSALTSSQTSSADSTASSQPQPGTEATQQKPASATSSTSSQPTTPSTTAPNPQPPAPPIDEEDAKWHTVGIFQNLSTTVTSYIDNTVWTSAGVHLNSDEIPDLSQYERINLEPGTAYRFRIRALNSVGASDWSEISSFKTCLPGFPGAPSAIKISKSSEGAHLTWEPPPSCVSSNEIVEYSVYLAVKPGKEKEAKAGQRAPAQLAFVRVYVGAANQCTVSHNSLSAAHVDCSNKPAIIFRIAARNEKGYGPATQVRWLQDPVQNSSSNPGMGANSLLSPTRVKPELGGASPSKRFKAAAGR
ncbi:host cell factor-like [Musca vetustissima]|uniref:host cell factor-like n=1 Tax=Musca vetustissima TaxID=27455 RepID=UPI002AB73CC3|nr:host cell factor-like [Musca vetustissima]